MVENDDDKPHGRSRYVQGCRCGICRTANREYQRDHRAGTTASVVVTLPGSGESVAEGVRAELAAIGSTEASPGLVAAAFAMARILDDPKAAPQQPAAAGKLLEILEQIRARTPRVGGKLAAMRLAAQRGGDDD